MTHNSEDELLGYALKVVATDKEHDKITSHLAECPECRLRLANIQKDIELMHYGPTRSFCLGLFKPALVVSRALQLTRPKAWIEQTAGAWIQNEKITH